MSNRIIEIPDEYLPEIDELPGDLKRIAGAIEEEWPGYGVKVAMLLGQLFPGVPLYMHNMEGLARRIRDDAIRKEYGKLSVKDLAIKYRLSTRQIKNILGQAPSQDELKRRQYSLF